MARLVISSPDGKRGILELTKSVITIGRGNANDLVLNDPSVSRYHAVIKQLSDGAVVVADRGSTNGVLLGLERIAGEHQFRPGDRVRIGIYELRVERVEDAALVVRRPDSPHTLDRVLRGEASVSLQASAPDAALAALAAQVKHLERENYLLRLLYDAGKALHSRLSIDEIANETVELAFRIEGVERGFVMLLDDDGVVSRQTEVRYRTPAVSRTARSGPELNVGTDQPSIIFSRAVLDRIRTEMEPILITDVRADERFRGSESMKISGLRSAMCAPLLRADQWDPAAARFSRRRLFGILYVDNLERAAAFTEEELDVFAVVAAQAAAAMANARAHTQLAEAAAQRLALERYLAPEVVEMIAANPQQVQLGGRNQVVTILFADIRGFTAIAERLEPQKIVELLNEFFTRVTDVIFDFGGTMDKYLGDGVLAVFGAPISKSNDALTAVRAAVAIQQLMQQLNRDAGARDWPELRVGIGLNTGAVTAANIGSPRRLEYTVVGDAVNVAARLMAHAAPGQILTTQATMKQLGDAFPTTALPPLLVKGKSEPLFVYAINWTEA